MELSIFLKNIYTNTILNNNITSVTWSKWKPADEDTATKILSFGEDIL
jgi:hypothetical protein